MSSRSSAQSTSRSEFWQTKARRLLSERGPAAVRDFVIDLGLISGPDSIFPIIKFLVLGGHATQALQSFAALARSFSDRLDLFELFGKQVTSNVLAVAPLPSGRARSVRHSDSEFVTVVGPSYVRAFGSGTRFLPIFIGIGPELTFLTSDLADASKQRYLRNIQRVDPRSLLLFTGGNADCLHHVRDTKGTRSAVEQGVLSSHEDVVHHAARRYCELVAEVLEKGAHNFAILCALPTTQLGVNQLINVYNADVKVFAAQRNIPTIDLTDDFTDPATGCLRAGLNVVEGDDHLTRELITAVERHLSLQGILPPECLPFEWEYLFRFQIEGTETRIWSESYAGPENVIHSQKVKFSQIMGRALNILVGALAAHPGSTVAIINGSEGFIACGIPLGISARTVSVNSRKSATIMARRIAEFIGRTDLVFLNAARTEASADDVGEIDVGFVTVHPWDDLEETIVAVQRLLSKIRRRVFVLTAADIEERLGRITGVSNVVSISLSNRLITGFWASARLIALAP